MKKYFILAVVSALFFVSCLKDAESNDGLAGVKIVEAYSTTKSFEVPVAGDGTVTQVVYYRADGDQEILATTDMPITIQIPAWLDEPVTRSTRAEGERIELVDYAKGTIDFEANSWIKDGSSVLMFEDSRTGDFDYNDVVLYVRHSIRGNNTPNNPAKITITVKPVAMGGKIGSVAFGWEDGNGEHILSGDVRSDYFGGQSDFINTENNSKPFYTMIPVVDDGSGNISGSGYTIFRDRALMERPRSTDASLDAVVGGYIVYDPVSTTCSTSSNDAKMIKWFIKVSGFKFYVASIDKSAPAGTFPYGISIPNAAYHAFERVPLEEAYPGFGSWIRTGSPTNWNSTKVKGKTYEAHVNYARW